MEGHHHPHHQHQQHPHPHPHISVNVDTSDRFPQWSVQETKEFLMIRAELDQTFMETKRNKLLWEVIATKMKEKGYNRSAEQCKCKWKNLYTRYKGCETAEPESLRQQFPFYNELQAILSARMQRMLWAEAEGAASGAKKKGAQLSSDDAEDNEDSEGEKGNPKKKLKKTSKGTGNTSGSGNNTNLKEILEDFMKQQMQMEMRWREAFEARENERRLREMEWRQTMEALENERIMMDQRWREREEQRRLREEARAEKRDALITALLNKLRREDM
ncbi:trihelix transcription factor GT-3b-like [Mangifera indica]|uniref:trihelix transcription factor GT-3b-like n=1 Tax=Mangifera indica TaxID=29780 RepID=UPI001CFBA5DB|nr:trihelix transcription factor GT-3b-like [Mangifera indica]XP_044492286.1 trihelix transcription factor GT-3b-like [Mangifera indica]